MQATIARRRDGSKSGGSGTDHVDLEGAEVRARDEDASDHVMVLLGALFLAAMWAAVAQAQTPGSEDMNIAITEFRMDR